MDIEQNSKDRISLLLSELKLIESKIDSVDEVRTKLLHSILELRMQYDGVVKQLSSNGYDTTNL